MLASCLAGLLAGWIKVRGWFWGGSGGIRRGPEEVRGRPGPGVRKQQNDVVTVVWIISKKLDFHNRNAQKTEGQKSMSDLRQTYVILIFDLFSDRKLKNKSDKS